MENYMAMPLSHYKRFCDAICRKAGVPTEMEADALMEVLQSIGPAEHPEVGFMPTEWDEKGYVTEGRFFGTEIKPYALACHFDFPTDYDDEDDFEVPSRKLTRIELASDNMRMIGEYAFVANRWLESVGELPDSIEIIGAYAFAWCEALKLSRVPDGITTITEGCFNACGSITEMTGLNVKIIERCAFMSCHSLTKAHFPVLEEIESDAFAVDNHGSLSEFVFPSSLKRIGDRVFMGQPITKISFRGTPDEISYMAFVQMKALSDIYVPWAEGDLADAPWGATDATIHYNWTPDGEE